jgi:hypothetical protein
VRPAVLAIAASALAAAACTSPAAPTCPGTVTAAFRLEGPLVSAAAVAADPALAALDPVPDVLDCTPDPADPAAPVRYPADLDPFDVRVASGPAAGAAALCRVNGTVYSGTHDGDAYSVEAGADSAILCGSACAATLRVVFAGSIGRGGAGEPATFSGLLVEELTEARGTCDACLPEVPAPSPAPRACAARYAVAGPLAP